MAGQYRKKVLKDKMAFDKTSHITLRANGKHCHQMIARKYNDFGETEKVLHYNHFAKCSGITYATKVGLQWLLDVIPQDSIQQERVVITLSINDAQL